jgi:hypothetical protein
MNHVTRLAFAMLMLGASAPALAAAGNGIRFGGSEGRVHPFIELQAGYDSNVYAAPSGSTDGDVIFHVRPGLTLSIPAETASVDFSGNLDWAQYLGNGNKATKDLSALFAAAKLGIGVNRKGQVGLEIEDTFRRSDRPQALSLATGAVSNYNAFDVRLPFRPGGGALSVTVNGGWSLETYSALLKYPCAPGSTVSGALCAAPDFDKMGYNEVGGGGTLAWKFLPRTSALFEAGYFKRIPNDAALSIDPAGYRIAVGVTGLVTPHFSTTLKLGYGNESGGAKTGSKSLGTWLATAEGEWLPSETASVKLGYQHDFGSDPSFLGPTPTILPLFEVHRLALAARQLVAGRFALGLRASLDSQAFSGGGSTAVTGLSPTVGVEVTRWLRGEVAYVYTNRSSSGVMTNAIPKFDKSEFWVKAVATY